MEVWFPQGVGHYLAGGLLIGLGVALLYLSTGWVGGMSTVYSAVWSWFSRHAYFQQARLRDSRVWRVFYALGLILGAWLCVQLFGVEVASISLPWWQLALGGFLVGYGARLSNGCTSGHGICGMAFLQLPSFVAVLIFMTTAMATALIMRALGLGA